MALTEVLKIVAEDRASHIIDGVANRAQYQFGASAKAAERFAKSLSGFAVESVVGFAKAGAASMVAFGAASVAALGAASYAALEAAAEYERAQGKITGQTSDLVSSLDQLSAAWNESKIAVGQYISQAAGVPNQLDLLAIGLREAAKWIVGGGAVSFVGGLVSAAERLPVVGAGVSVLSAEVKLIAAEFRSAAIAAAEFDMSAKAILETEKAAKRERTARQQAIDDGTGPTTALGAKAGKSGFYSELKKQEEAKRKAAEARKQREASEWEDKQAAEEAANAASQAAFNRMMAERDKAREQLDRAEKVERMQREFAAAEEERLNREKLDREAAINRAREEGQERAKEQERQVQEVMYGTVNALSNGITAAASFWRVMNDGAASTSQKVGGVLQLMGTLVGGVLSIFAPGAGGAVGGLLGALGGVLSGFQNGGVARAQSGMVVRGVGGGDRVPIMAERGETIVPARGGHPDFIQEVAAAALSAGGGGGGTVILNQGYLVPPTMVQTKRVMATAVVPALSSLAQDGRARIQDPRIRGSNRGRRI